MENACTFFFRKKKYQKKLVAKKTFRAVPAQLKDFYLIGFGIKLWKDVGCTMEKTRL